MSYELTVPVGAVSIKSPAVDARLAAVGGAPVVVTFEVPNLHRSELARWLRILATSIEPNPPAVMSSAAREAARFHRKVTHMTNEEIERAAIAAHEANRAYCHAIGDDQALPWGAAAQWQRQSVIAGVRFHVDNPEASPSESHESWLAAKARDGWKYGPVKDAEKKEHPCFLPYDQLPESQKAKDAIFLAVVRGVIAHYEESAQQ